MHRVSNSTSANLAFADSTAATFAEWLRATVLWPVAHRQIVLTIPKMLRAYFRYDRRLLGELCRVGADVITKSFRVLLGTPRAEPGLVVCVHPFGNLLHITLASARHAAIKSRGSGSRNEPDCSSSIVLESRFLRSIMIA